MQQPPEKLPSLWAGLKLAATRRSHRMASLARRVEDVRFLELQGRGLLEGLQLYAPRLRYFAYALLSVGLAALVVMALQAVFPPALFRVNAQNVSIIFIIACAFAAGRYGLLPGLVASVAASFTLNYFFINPYDGLGIISVTDALNMALFLAAAVIISLVTSITRKHAQQAHERDLYTRALFTLHRAVADTFSRREALEALQKQLGSMLEKDVAFFLPAANDPAMVELAVPATLELGDADRRALEQCWAQKIRVTYASLARSVGWSFYPMVSASGAIGVLGIRPRTPQHAKPWLRPLYPAIADQTAAVLAHIELERDMEKARINEEREKLRSMLLSSISHDLKTPLATIIGTMGMLRGMASKISPEKQSELLEVAYEEAQRLDRHITNILDMTRLESGTIRFNMQWHNMDEILRHVEKRLQHRLRNHRLILHPCPKNVEVYMDATLTEQVLQNLLDNACKYTAAATLIEVACRSNAEGFSCEVRDHGHGLPEEKLPEIFDKYVRLQKKDKQVAGTGLGLAIARAMMQGQGGSINASNHPDGGVSFVLNFPTWKDISATKRPVKSRRRAQA